MFAAHNRLTNLIAITDWNGQQIDGTVNEVFGVGDLEAKWKAFGWNVIVADGHNMEAILAAFKQAKEEGAKAQKPVMILMKTNMGKGVDFMEGTCEWHGKAPKPELAQKALEQLQETLGDY
jgi:transketolase